MSLRRLIIGAALATAVAAAADSAPVTFNRAVAPLLQKHCQGCHRPGEIGPMPLLTYQDARPWAKAIREAVLTRRMPPWPVDPRFGKFANDRSIASDEIRTLVAWADAGAPEGDPRDLPPPRKFHDGWNIQEPDVILEMPNAFHVPASGVLEYQHVILPTGFTEDKWVQMAEMRPGDRSVVHHMIAFIRTPESRWMRDQTPGEVFALDMGSRRRESTEVDNRLQHLVGYAPGHNPQQWLPGHAKLVRAGSDIVLQMHYTSNGKAAADRSRLGLVFAKEPPAKRVFTMTASNRNLVIPPGAPDHRVDSQITLNETVHLLSFRPHMHLRGKDFEYRVVYPTGESEIVFRAAYNFNWQPYYYLAKPLLLPKGSRIECTAHFDNSPNNKFNPDPTQEVRWGDQSWEEMMIGWFDVAFDAAMDHRRVYEPRAAVERPAAAAN